MNHSKTVFLINKNARAILATYEEQDSAPRTMFKTLDPTIKKDDFIIVPTSTRHKMTVCKVVDTDVDVDFDGSETLLWVIGKVDRTPYEQTLAQEETALQKIKAAELRKKRNDLRDALLADSMDEIKALPIAVMNGDEKKE